jgi:hypothetical protein
MPNFSRRTVIKSAAVIGALQIGSPFAAKTTEAAQVEGAVAGPKSAVSLHVGWYELHPDVSLNFQLNRWAAYGGPRFWFRRRLFVENYSITLKSNRRLSSPTSERFLSASWRTHRGMR